MKGELETIFIGEADDLRLDFKSLPDHAKERIAAAAYRAFTDFMRRPDARALLDSVDERLRREGSTLLQPKKKGGKTV